MSDHIDISGFSRMQRRVVKRLALFDEHLCNLQGVGQSTIDQLMAWGVVQETGQFRHGQPTYTLTDEGNRVHEALRKDGKLPR